MRSSLSRWSVGVVLSTLLLGISGCKGGVTSPTNWLSWGKTPSPRAISGGPRKPSASALPGPRTTAQTELANNARGGYGTQGYPTGATNSPAGYDNGPYGMASHSTAPTPSSTSPYGYGTQTGSPYASNVPGQTPPYGTGSAQPAAHAGVDNSYRTAASRSAAVSYDAGANAYSGQPAAYPPAQGTHTPQATQNWGTPPTAVYPTGGETSTAGLNTVAGPFQPGSTVAGAILGVTNLQGATHPGIAPTAFGSGAQSGYQAPTGLQSVTPAGYPAAGAGTYPATNASPYPATNAGQGYTSPYPKSGY